MAALPFVALGDNATRVFGLSAATRARRFAAKARLQPRDQLPADEGAILADLSFAFDPAWLPHLKADPGLAVTLGGRVALAHAPDAASAAGAARAMRLGTPLPPGFATLAAESGEGFYNLQLRKRESAYLMPLAPETARAVEKASYDGAYKGVTDLLTLYLWRGAAFHLTRWAGWAGISPNAITIFGTALCIWTVFLFLAGHLWAGLGVGLVFMVLDTVDGKLARCTGTSSEFGNILDHGLDLVHPPFWYWAWGVGCAVWGEPMAASELWGVMAVILVGYVVQRLIEGAFIAGFGMHIHVWRRFDSKFRLVTARRNPNMVILFLGALLMRPREALVAVAWWTAISCAVHLVRLGQAWLAKWRGEPVVSWLA